MKAIECASLQYKKKEGVRLKIIERRKELGISQKELAEKCHVSQGLICDIETGRCKPSLETALKIAGALGLDDIRFFEDLVTLKK